VALIGKHEKAAVKVDKKGVGMIKGGPKAAGVADEDDEVS
jgi:hypothetical protein